MITKEYISKISLHYYSKVSNLIYSSGLAIGGYGLPVAGRPGPRPTKALLPEWHGQAGRYKGLI